MITHDGVRYWTTEELANSLEARGWVKAGGTQRQRLKRARRWAEGVDLRPTARTVTGGLLWAEDATRHALGVDNVDGPAYPETRTFVHTPG